LAVRLRLRRIGQKKQPIYKIVAADSRSPRDGRFIEVIGTYNPMIDPALITVNEEKAMRWLTKGAEPTETVRSLLKRKGVWIKWDLMRRGKPAEFIASEMEKWNLQQAAKVEREAEKKARRAARKKEAVVEPAAPAAEAAAPQQ